MTCCDAAILQWQGYKTTTVAHFVTWQRSVVARDPRRPSSAARPPYGLRREREQGESTLDEVDECKCEAYYG